MCLVLSCLSYIPAKCLSWLRTDYLKRQMTPLTILLAVRKPADRPAVAASLNRDLARIQEWCNHWCMIPNPNETKALVVSISRTVSHPHENFILSGVSVRASLNLDILGVKFDGKLTFKDHVHGLVSSVSQRIGILGLVKRIFATPLCYFVAIFHLFSQSLSIILRFWGQLLNVTFSFLSTRCIRWKGFMANAIWRHHSLHTKEQQQLLSALRATSFY